MLSIYSWVSIVLGIRIVARHMTVNTHGSFFQRSGHIGATWRKRSSIGDLLKNPSLNWPRTSSSSWVTAWASRPSPQPEYTKTSDSANTATAYLCGVKANIKTLGVDSSIKAGMCHANETSHLPSIMKWAQDSGKWTGVVTTTRVTEATPAAAYAHSGHRSWQSKVPQDCGAKDIAYQLVHQEPGSELRVVMGGGRDSFLNQTSKGERGYRVDGRNLTDDWVKNKSSTGKIRQNQGGAAAS
uniref:alkaline phosphatase n=1 Tax=Ixodes ricinus TaxID=34613 RepID=A0A0K8RMP3_IXORI